MIFLNNNKPDETFFLAGLHLKLAYILYMLYRITIYIILTDEYDGDWLDADKEEVL